MAAAVHPFNFNFTTPDIHTALISAGSDSSYFQPHAPSGSEFAEKFGSVEQNADFFGFDNHASDQQSLFAMDISQPPVPPSLTPPGMADQSENVSLAPRPLQIDTSHSLGQARLQNGQYTPSDDQIPPESEFTSPTVVPGVPIKQETDETSQPNLPKRKRSSAANDSQPTKKRRRSRKSSSETECLNPVEDDKRNKFLERNRVAASKCRQKKKEWTQNLEVQARELQASKTQLQFLASSLRDEVMWLKNEMLKHTNCGCHHIREYLSREAESIATGARSSTMTINRPATANTESSTRQENASQRVELGRRDSISDHSTSSFSGTLDTTDTPDTLAFTDLTHGDEQDSAHEVD